MTTTPQHMLLLKKYAYLLIIIPPALIFLSEQLWLAFGHHNLFAFSTLIFVYLMVPVMDHIIGKDAVNPDEEKEVPALSGQRYYRWLTLLVLPLQLVALVYGGYLFMTTDFSWIGATGWLLSVGTCSVTLAINVAHELIHKDTRTEQWSGGLLLATVCYSGFKVEHIRGHHVHVSTPEDASSSRYGQSLYQFLPHAIVHNTANAWKLEAQRLRKAGHSPLSWHNELIWWNVISIAFAAMFTLTWGWMGLVYFLGQSLVAITLLEIINYVEHYGLHRRKLDNGRYERTTIEHSWNSNYLLTNLFLFQLQRHSDHHANPKRRYQVLRHHEESPQLPSGYATMVVLALLPPLWFRVMNPRVEHYYQGEEHQLTNAS